MSPKDQEAILVYVLERFLEPGDVVLTRGNVNQFSSAVLKCLESLGWRLDYDPRRLRDTIADAVNKMAPLPEADEYPALPPERLVG